MPRRRNNPVILTGKDRGTLEGLIARGHAPVRLLTHARILLKADEGEDAPGEAWPDVKIAEALQVSRSTVARVRQRGSSRRGGRPRPPQAREDEA